jgi:flagellar motility protein MotE (MotC chaperone)
MNRFLRDFRLIPILLIATACLLALKTIGLMSGSGYTLAQRLASNQLVVTTTVPTTPVQQMRSPAVQLAVPSDQPKRSWMQEIYNYPGGDVTGSVHGAPKKKDPPKEEPKEEKKDPAAPPDGKVVVPEPQRSISAGERALLERLQERRQELDARQRELDLRESLLKAAEKKLETPAGSEKSADGKGGTPAQRKEDTENARFKSVVVMYETMKPKDAAKIFDRLDVKVVLELASQIKPQQMSAILAQMSAEAAERLTVEMATHGGSGGTNPSNLPKIGGN